MRQPSHSDHLARVTTRTDACAGRVLSLGWKLFLNAALMLMPVLMFGLLAPIIGFGVFSGSSKAMLLAIIGIVVVLVAQIAWAGTYPEWPTNQLLLRRLRNQCRLRRNRSRRDWIEAARMVEWVPRDNWSATKLDTAEDVMLIRVGDDGVEMEGDRSHYLFPPASIIDVEVESIRPVGCFHWLHYVVLTVRTEGGPMEFPLSYRDHKLGRLRSSHRQRQTHQLRQAICGVATGGELTYSYNRNDSAYSDLAHTQIAGPVQDRLNPYAAPRSV